MIDVMVQDRCQCDPKKCTAKRMVKFGLAKNIGVASIPAGSILLSPHAEKALSPEDVKYARRRGLVVMDLTWTNIEEFPKVAKVNERSLPYLIASNPINWGKPMMLNSAEAILASLIILGENEQAGDFIKRFNWGPEFLRLNGEMLEDYAKAKNSEEVISIQHSYLENDQR